MKILLTLSLLLSCLVACSDDDVVAPPGGACGGFSGAECGANEYCDYPQNTCGVTDETGVCKPRPDACPLLFVAEPTCGCDGVVYGSACDATEAGTDLNAAGGCAVTAGSFKCGYRQCSLNNQYCQSSPSDVTSVPGTFACNALPACPAGTTCDCLEGQACGETCSGEASTGLTLTCQAG